MRVLSVIETLQHGGAETVLVDLVLGLRAHEHRVVHFSHLHTEEVHPWIAAALSPSVPCLDVPWEALHAPEARRRTLDDFEPDIVIYHWWGQDSLRPWMAATQSVPRSRRPSFVIVLHRSGLPVKPGYDAYVLVSASQKPQVTGIDAARVFVIPNAVDLTRFERSAPPRPAWRPFTVGRLSNLRLGKIPPDWVRTAAAFGLRGARFVIAGDGPLRSILDSDIKELGLESLFSLPGYVPRKDVPRLLTTFDVFCYVTSTAVECHPLALLEAGAAGLPIVAEARGGVPDIVSHGTNGLLAHSSEEVGSWLRLLQRDEALRAQLGRGARQMAALHSLERQLDAYEDLLRVVARDRAA